MKKITAAVCLDDNLGMMFYGKRQSRDRVLCKDFLESVMGRPVYVNAYTKKLFEEEACVIVSNDPLKDAPNGAAVFAEDLDIEEYLPEIDEFIIYRWNRAYPGSKFFTVYLKKEGFSLISFKEFEGSSHEKIRKEIYRKGNT